MRQSYGFLLRIRRKLHSLTIISARFAANVANLAETKSWYGEGTELVRSGSSYDVLWRRFGKSKVVHDGKGYC